MATLLSAYYFQVGAQIKGLETDLKRAERITQSSASRMSAQFKSVAKRSAVMGGAIASAFAVAAKQSVGYADKIAKSADKIGLSTDALQEYRFAAKLAGVEQSTLDMAMQRFSRRVAEVASGTGELQKVAQQYGVEMRHMDGTMKSNNELMDEFADLIKNAESQQEQLRIAFKLFDSEGAAVVNMLKDGSAGLDEMRQRAHELGVVIDEDLLRKAEQTSNKFDILATVTKTKLTVAMLENADAIDDVTDALVSMVDWGGKAVNWVKRLAEEVAQFNVKSAEDQLNDLIVLRQQVMDMQRGNVNDVAAFMTGVHMVQDWWGGRELPKNLEEIDARIAKLRRQIATWTETSHKGQKQTEDTGQAVADLTTWMEGLHKVHVDVNEVTDDSIDKAGELADEYQRLQRALDPMLDTVKRFQEAQRKVNELQQLGADVTDAMRQAIVNEAFGLDATADNAEFIRTWLTDFVGIAPDVIDAWEQIGDAMSRAFGMGGTRAPTAPKPDQTQNQGIFDSSIGLDQAVQQATQQAASALGQSLGISTGGLGAGLGSVIGAYFGGPIGSAIGGLLGGVVDDLFGSKPKKPQFQISSQHPIEGARDLTRQTVFGQVVSHDVHSIDLQQITDVMNQIVNFDRQLALTFDPSQYDAITSALAGFDEAFRESGATAEEVLRRRFITALDAAEPAISSFVQSFGDLNAMLDAFEGIEKLRDMVADADNALLALSDSFSDNITAQLNRMDTALDDARTAFDQALKSMDPQEIASAGQAVQQQMIARYELEKQLIQQLQSQLLDLKVSSRDFAAGIAQRLADLGRPGALAGLVDVTRQNMQGARRDVLNAANPQETMAALSRFIGRVDAWLDAATNRIQSQIAALDDEANQIIARGQERAQAAAERAQRAAQAAANARQVELQAINKQLQAAQAWAGILDSVTQQIRNLQFSQSNPASGFVQLTALNQRIAQFGQPGTADQARELQDLLNRRIELAQQQFQRFSPEYQRIYNETMRQLAAIQDKAKSEAEIANELQAQANKLQQQTTSAVSGGFSRSMILTQAEQERLDAIRAEQERLRQQQEDVNARAAGFYTWAQEQWSAAEDARHAELMDGLYAITGGLDPDSFLAQEAKRTADGIQTLIGTIEDWLASIENYTGPGSGSGAGAGGQGDNPGHDNRPPHQPPASKPYVEDGGGGKGITVVIPAKTGMSNQEFQNYLVVNAPFVGNELQKRGYVR